MSHWVKVATIAEIPLNHPHVIHTEHLSLILINLEGDFYAIQDICSHDGGNLSDGWLEGKNMVCPRHGAQFCIKTGDAMTPPAYEPICTFPVKIEQGEIWVEIP